MLITIINFITKTKAVFVLCLILAIGLNLFYFNIFTNARPLSVIQQNSDSITFGVSVERESIPNNINLVSGPWILSKWEQHNSDWLGKFNEPINFNKTPYLYLYITAGKARSDWNLEDCNTGAEKTKTLCYRGAEYLRSNRQYVNQAYKDAANNIKNNYGTTKEIALHIEPDFYQYASSDQLNGGLTFDEAAKDLNEWTDSIKQILPNARLVMDVSPWNSDLKGWSSKMRNFDYAGIVGKNLPPNGDGTTPAGVDGRSYAKISQDTGKQLILDDSHGVGGYWLPFDYDWSNKDLASKRLKDGVVAVILPPNDLNFLNGMVVSNTAQNYKTSESSSSLSKSSSSFVVEVSSVPPKLQANDNTIIIESPKSKISTSAMSSHSSSEGSVSREYNLNNRIVIPSPSSYNKSKLQNLSSSSISRSKPAAAFSQIVCSANLVDFSMTKGDNWQSGFVTQIKIKNNSSSPINSWDINLITEQNQEINNSWNLKRDGNYMTPNSEWNSQIQPGQEVNVGGFTINHNGSDSIPTLRCATY
jgi:Cellulose binding domain